MSKLLWRVQQQLSFSKKEFNGIVVFCFLIVVVLCVPWIYELFRAPNKAVSFDAFDKEARAFYAQKLANVSPYRREESSSEGRTKGELFSFDPNTASEADWQRLGLTARQIKTIVNYKAKGGHFYRKQDVAKMYCIGTDFYAKLEPYIEIKSAVSQGFVVRSVVKGVLVLVELNGADSLALVAIRGIGPAFAHRILKYRNRLGGFYAKEQLKEVWGLDSAKYEAIAPFVRVNAALLKKIKVNEATVEVLRALPYLSYKQLYAIVNYRQQHGNFKQIADLKAILLLNEDVLRKMEPYLSFD